MPALAAWALVFSLSRKRERVSHAGAFSSRRATGEGAGLESHRSSPEPTKGTLLNRDEKVCSQKSTDRGYQATKLSRIAPDASLASAGNL